MIKDEQFYEKALDLFTESLNSKDDSIYSSMPYAKFANSFMCKQFMTKKNLRDTPAPTCIKYQKMVNDLLNKDYKYKVKAMLDS